MAPLQFFSRFRAHNRRQSVFAMEAGIDFEVTESGAMIMMSVGEEETIDPTKLLPKKL